LTIIYLFSLKDDMFLTSFLPLDAADNPFEIME